MSSIVSILLAILMLGILIAIHEAGHFWAARLTRIEVREFAIGFGPKLFGWTSRKRGTRFALRAIPLGGYCAFYGEDDVDGSAKDDPRSFTKQKVWKRMITVLMGPIMNFVLAFVVMIGFSFFYYQTYDFTGIETYSLTPYVEEVKADTPAERAGLQAGDLIVSVNGVSATKGITTESTANAAFSLMIDAWQEGDEPLTIVVQRGDETVKLYATPENHMIGITWTPTPITKAETGIREVPTRGLTFGESIETAWDKCISAGRVIYDALGALITRGEGLEQTGGPVAVVSEVSKSVQAYGLPQYFWLLCVISINLGIMNLLPIPGLDGARFLFMVIEAIFRRPVPRKVEAIINVAGTLLLLAVMLFFTGRDIWRLFQ